MFIKFHCKQTMFKVSYVCFLASTHRQSAMVLSIITSSNANLVISCLLFDRIITVYFL